MATAPLEAARELVITCAQIAFTLAGSSLCAIAIWWLLTSAPDVGAQVVDVLSGAIPLSTKIAALLGTPIVAWLGSGFALWKARGLVRWIADRLFPPFDTDLLRAIGRPGPLDPLWLPPTASDCGMRPLPWVTPPPDSPRRPVWNALIAFLSDNVGDGRFNLLGYPQTRFARFRWVMLTGRPGSGKTRMATELARARARRELLDGHRAEWRLAYGAWLRSVWPFAQRRESVAPGARDDAPWDGADPWDSGWIVSTLELGGIGHAQRSRFDEGLLSSLRAWRPRRPTVLVLDDPRPGDAGRVIDALLSGEARYRHPVRLIVVNQALPQELGFAPNSDGSWSANPRGFAGSVLALGGAATLSAGEVRRMFGALCLSGHVSGWTPTDDNVRRLLRDSRGNPFLVCLALQRIQRLPNTTIEPPDKLLLDRAQRIIEALEAAGVGTAEHLRAIAWATLAGGSNTSTELPAEGRSDDWPGFEPAALDAVPNLALAWPAPAPPLVQPEPIGDAFVRLILSKCDVRTQRRVIAAAWRANPSGMLAVASRFCAQDDPLAGILRTGPPAEAGLAPVDVAVAYSVAACSVPRMDWDAGEIPRQGRATLAAVRRIRVLTPDQAAGCVLRLIKVFDVPNAIAILRGRAPLLCISVALRRSLEDDQSWSAPDVVAAARAQIPGLFRVLKGCGTDARRDLRARMSSPLAALVESIGSRIDDLSTLEDWVNDLDKSLEVCQTPGSAWSMLSGLARCVADRAAAAPVMTARAHRLTARAHLMLGDKTTVWEAAHNVDTAVRPFAGDRNFEIEHVRAWRYVAAALRGDAARCESAARYVDDSARPFAGDRDFELERVRVWRTVAEAQRDDATRCESAARYVDDSARPFAGDLAFELERVRAWCTVAYTQRDDAARCESMARRVDDLTRPFAADRDFEYQRVQAWRYVTYAQRGDSARCKSAARHVDDLTLPFAGDCDFELERARAWRYVAYTQRNDAPFCERAARHVDDLARPFAGEPDFELQRVEVWSYVVGTQHDDMERSESAARYVDDLARPFAGDLSFEKQRVHAWRSVVYAQREHAARCESTARHIDDLARPFAGDRDFELERAVAWSFVTYATRDDAARCESATRNVDDLTRRFAGDPYFERVREFARRMRGDPWEGAADSSPETPSNEEIRLLRR